MAPRLVGWRRFWAATVVAMVCFANDAVAQPAIFAPDSATTPFENWSRGAAGSTYAEWDTFESPAGPNAPDVGYFGFADAAAANVAEQSGTAFITSGGNIYSFSGPTDFDVTLPGPALGAGFNTRFVAQMVTLGTEVDTASLRISYDGGEQDLAAAYAQELNRTELGGFGGYLVTTIFAWDIASASPGEFLLEFNAIGSSMSLANLAIDVFSQSQAFAAFPGDHSVPGDYDHSGYVDAADFAKWKQQYGTAGPDADGNADSFVNAADYTIWRNNLGAGTPPAAGTGGIGAVGVPEPSTAVLLGVVLLFVFRLEHRSRGC